MGYALMWLEGLAVMLSGIALATAWAARGSRLRAIWPALVLAVVALTAAVVTFVTHGAASGREFHLVRTSWFPYSLAWLVAFTAAGLVLLYLGLRRPEAGLGHAAASWSRRRMWLAFGGALLAFGFTFWNMDLSARADLTVARQQAGAALLTMSEPPVADADNAAPVYAAVTKELDKPLPERWRDAARNGLDAKEPMDWKDAAAVEFVKQHESELTLMRKAAAMPGCNFNYQRGPLDVVSRYGTGGLTLPSAGVTLLAIDARVKAIQGNAARAIEDVAAMLGAVRHVSRHIEAWSMELMAWRTLEDVLRLTPPGKYLPPLAIPELPPIIRQVRQEHALLGMIFPVVASQPSLLEDEMKQKNEPWHALLVEVLVIPSRVFVIPDELAAMHKLIEDYQQAPPSSRDEKPEDWTKLRQSAESDPTGFYGCLYIKPRQRKIASDGGSLAALRQTARTGLALTAYRHKHGTMPERLEQLAPEFLPSVPVDPRDGQPLRMKRVGEKIVVYPPADAAEVESGEVKSPDYWRAPTIFRLNASGDRAK